MVAVVFEFGSVLAWQETDREGSVIDSEQVPVAVAPLESVTFTVIGYVPAPLP